MNQHPEGILICDFGSQYTHLIARRLRELGVYTQVIQGAIQPSFHMNIRGIILSGGPDSVSSTKELLRPWLFKSGVPILGICLGMQALAHYFQGKVVPGETSEYGNTPIWVETVDEQLCPKLEKQIVWMSHGDSVFDQGPEFEVLARSDLGVIASMRHKYKPYYGLQFHPEVAHTDHGVRYLQGFVKVTGMSVVGQASSQSSLFEEAQKMIHATIGASEEKVLVAVSGGVDSTVLSVLLRHTLGRKQLHAVLIDTGLLRKNEVSDVTQTFNSLDIELHVLNEQETFLNALQGVTEPEEKRQIIGRTFIECFEAYIQGRNFGYLAQGTLYPDVIESAGEGQHAKLIKSHHNVGGLPEKLALKLIEPFRYLFKDEVRQMGHLLKIPEQILSRHPFPGPGLGVRIPGEVTREKILVLQEADAIFIENLRAKDLYHKVWQAGVVLLPIKSIGVVGDLRRYEWVACLRAVDASDGMTAKVYPLPMDFLTEVADQIVQLVPKISRVLFDITGKPPATIEWE